MLFICGKLAVLTGLSKVVVLRNSSIGSRWSNHKLQRAWVTTVLLLVNASAFAAPVGADLHALIDKHSAAIEAEVIAWRRDIHEHPELSNREVRTAALVAKHLQELGLEVTTQVAHTGVVGILRGSKATGLLGKVGGVSGGVVALRADMDALPVTEQTGLAYASVAKGEYEGKEVGVMHACGHDNHVAILMGVASVLSKVREQFTGTVKFIFQPAEEGAPKGEKGGAELMIQEGVLTNPTVDAVFGLHISQGGATGEVSYRPQGTMASAQRFDIEIQGRQTHAARPWAGVDPIAVGAQIVTALQTIVSRNVDVTNTPAVVTVGTFHAGIRNNIVPDTASLSGTIRTFDPAVRADIHQRITNIVEQIASAMGASATVEIDPGVPVTFNDVGLTESSLPTLRRVYGAGKVTDAPLITGAEDFAFFQERVPGFYFFIGARPKELPVDKAIPNHSPLFYVDEAALLPGVRAMASLAVDYLGQSQRK